jgi:2-polyprenyl-3-methyl-5-hydroxy-6-metoxy-1,4-benzoquinol methylase
MTCHWGSLKPLITTVDRALIDREPAWIRAAIEAEDPFGPTLWPEQARSIIMESRPPARAVLHWQLERYYAQRWRQTQPRPLREHLELLGYARVIDVVLSYEEGMGYEKDELAFVELALAKYAGTGSPLGGISVLEVGCGSGHLLAELSNMGCGTVVGLDSNPASVRETRRRVSTLPHPPEIWGTSLGTLPLPYRETGFDVVVCCDVLEHIDPRLATQFCRQLYEAVAPSGLLVLVTPNTLSGPHDVTRHFRPTGSRAEGFHLCEYKLAEVDALLSTAGFGGGEALLARPTKVPGPEALSARNLAMKIRLERDLELGAVEVRFGPIEEMYFKGVTYRRPP